VHSRLLAVRQRTIRELEGERIVPDHRGPVEIQYEMVRFVPVGEAPVNRTGQFSGEIIKHGGDGGGQFVSDQVLREIRVYVAQRAPQVDRVFPSLLVGSVPIRLCSLVLIMLWGRARHIEFRHRSDRFIISRNSVCALLLSHLHTACLGDTMRRRVRRKDLTYDTGFITRARNGRK